jgi:hypothetical protein
MVFISVNWAGFSMRRSSTSFSKSVSWFESRLIFSDGFFIVTIQRSFASNRREKSPTELELPRKCFLSLIPWEFDFRGRKTCSVCKGSQCSKFQLLTLVIGVGSASNTTVSSRRDLVQYPVWCLCRKGCLLHDMLLGRIFLEGKTILGKKSER